MLPPTEQLRSDAARVRRVLLGKTLCQDCGAERGIGATQCMACRRCCSCGAPNCHRECCAEDAGMETARVEAEFGRLRRVAGLVLAALAAGPIAPELREAS